MARTGASRAAIVVGLFALFTAIRAITTDPVIGFPFLLVLPIGLAAVWFGRVGAVLAALAATGLYVGIYVAVPARGLKASDVPGTIPVRLLVYLGIALAMSVLVDRQKALAAEVALRERELQELRALRQVLVPPAVPELPGLLLAASYTPASGVVAGDFHFARATADGGALLAVGDVVGHGVQAARQAAFVRASLATLSEFETDPGRLLQLVNLAMIEGMPEGEFVTAVVAHVAPDGTLRLGSAGHPAPWSIGDAAPVPVDGSGLPLGVAADCGCGTSTQTLPRSGLLLFSDGLTEARAAERTRRPEGPGLFGEDRLAQALGEHGGLALPELLTALRSRAEEWAGSELADDLCLLAVRARQPALGAG